MLEKQATMVIDLETLGKWSDGIILTLGACIMPDTFLERDVSFSELMQNTVHLKFSVSDQVKLGRKSGADVVQWWKDQGESAKSILLPREDDLPIDRLFAELEKWMVSHGYGWKGVRVYDRQKFDIDKLQHLYEVTLNKGHRVPWDYLDCWDISSALQHTMGDRYGGVNPRTFNDPSFIYHNAACDAALDMLRFHNMARK